MKLTMESTATVIDIVTGNGEKIPVRLWQGTTAKGVRCSALIIALGVDNDADHSEFDQLEHEEASEDAAAFAAQLANNYGSNQRPC